MAKRLTTPEQRRKHERVEAEFLAAAPLTVAEVERLPSAPLGTFQSVQELVASLRRNRSDDRPWQRLLTYTPPALLLALALFSTPAEADLAIQLTGSVGGIYSPAQTVSSGGDPVHLQDLASDFISAGIDLTGDARNGFDLVGYCLDAYRPNDPAFPPEEPSGMTAFEFQVRFMLTSFEDEGQWAIGNGPYNQPWVPTGTMVVGQIYAFSAADALESGRGPGGGPFGVSVKRVVPLPPPPPPPAPQVYQFGDLNNDGAFDIADVVYALQALYMSGPQPWPVEVYGKDEADSLGCWNR